MAAQWSDLDKELLSSAATGVPMGILLLLLPKGGRGA